MDTGYLNTQLILGIMAVLLGVTYFWSVAISRKASTIFLDRTRKQLKLVKKTQISHDTAKFTFSLGGANVTLGLPIGQHVYFHAPNIKGKVPGEWNGKEDLELDAEIKRKYTPITGDEQKGYVDFIVKLYSGKVKPEFVDGGKMSNYLASLNIGSKIDVVGPVGKLVYNGNGSFTFDGTVINGKHIGMVAGGSGITPMLQVIQFLLNENSVEIADISLLFANKTEEDILVREELEAIRSKYPKRFKLSYTLDHPPPNWIYETGFITAELISKHMPPPSADTIILMCGPPPMILKACKPNFESLGYDMNKVLKF